MVCGKPTQLCISLFVLVDKWVSEETLRGTVVALCHRYPSSEGVSFSHHKLNCRAGATVVGDDGTQHNARLQIMSPDLRVILAIISETFT